MLRTLAEPLPETVAVVSISVSSIELAPRWPGSNFVQDDATPKGLFALVVFSQKRVRGSSVTRGVCVLWRPSQVLELGASAPGRVARLAFRSHLRGDASDREPAPARAAALRSYATTRQLDPGLGLTGPPSAIVVPSMSQIEAWPLVF